MRYYYVACFIMFFFSCKKEQSKVSITSVSDYQEFLNQNDTSAFERALSEKEYWSKKLKPDSMGIGHLGPLANAYSQLFEATNNVEYLKLSEQVLLKAISISAKNKDRFERALAENYIAQYRLTEAQQILEKSFKSRSNKRATRMLLFDVYLEREAYKKVDSVLSLIKNTSDFNYLVRLAKWNNYNSEYGASIRNLKSANKIAQSRKSNTLIAETNLLLAKQYLKTGEIEKAYYSNIKVLEAKPDIQKAKENIAWIVFTYEHNNNEAKRILESIDRSYVIDPVILKEIE